MLAGLEHLTDAQIRAQTQQYENETSPHEIPSPDTSALENLTDEQIRLQTELYQNQASKSIEDSEQAEAAQEAAMQEMERQQKYTDERESHERRTAQEAQEIKGQELKAAQDMAMSKGVLPRQLDGIEDPAKVQALSKDEQAAQVLEAVVKGHDTRTSVLPDYTKQEAAKVIGGALRGHKTREELHSYSFKELRTYAIQIGCDKKKVRRCANDDQLRALIFELDLPTVCDMGRG
jgi:hypothetical protein